MHNNELKITIIKKLRNYNNNNFRKLHDEYFLKIPFCRPWRGSNPVAPAFHVFARKVPKRPETMLGASYFGQWEQLFIVINMSWIRRPSRVPCKPIQFSNLS